MFYLFSIHSLAFFLLLVPQTIDAAVNNLFETGGVFISIFNILVAVIIGLALIYFIWGIARYMGSGGDAQTRVLARNQMIFGIVALFVMVSVWGLVAILVQTFGTTQTVIPVISPLCDGGTC